MAFDVLSVMNLDREALNGKMLLAKELSGVEGNFFFSCMISKQLKDKGAVHLVGVHHDFEHYHSVGSKMAYNLKASLDAGTVVFTDFMTLQSDLSELFETIRSSTQTQLNTHRSACIIIDDLTHFLHMNFPISDIIKFVHACKKLILDDDRCSLIVGVHVTSEQHDPSSTLARFVSHMCDIICEVHPLKTGRSVDVTGSLRVIKPWCDHEVGGKLTKLDSYLFKTFDRGVKVFAAGTR